MNGSIFVVRRSVYRVDFQILRLGYVYHVVPRSRGNYDSDAVFYVVFFPVDDAHTVSSFEPEELVVIRMDLHADFLAWLQAHENELEMLASVDNPSKIDVFERPALDIFPVSFHICTINE